MKVELNTSLLPILDAGQYDTVISLTSYDEEWSNSKEESERFDYISDYESGEYDNEIVKIAQGYLNDCAKRLNKYGVKSIKGLRINSPREYNFYTDTIIMEVELDDNLKSIMNGYIEQWTGNKEMNRYFKNHFKSHSGFISYMPESFSELSEKIDFNEFDEYVVAAYLTMCMINEELILHEDFQDFSSYQYDFETEVVEIQCNYVIVQSIISDELKELYQDDNRINNLIMEVLLKIGWKWRSEKDSDYDGKYDDAVRFVLWAQHHDFTIYDLEHIEEPRYTELAF